MDQEIKVTGTNAISLGNEIRAGRVKSGDVLILTYDGGDKIEVLYREGAPYLIAATDTPREIWRRRTFARGCLRDDSFTGWERKGSEEELYGKK